jgi:hypothetical protein
MRLRYRAVVTFVLAVGVASTMLTGCTAARNGLGTRASSCFRVLPEAHAAAGLSSTFDGVLSASPVVLVKAVRHESHGPPPVSPAVLVQDSHETTCLVAFRGTFRLSRVTRGWAPGPGPYRRAVVVVRQSNAALLATVLFHRLPRTMRFSDGST